MKKGELYRQSAFRDVTCLDPTTAFESRRFKSIFYNSYSPYSPAMFDGCTKAEAAAMIRARKKRVRAIVDVFGYRLLK